MNITIDNKEITLKYSFRGFMLYEQLTEKSFKPNGLNEVITLFYCIVMSSDKEIAMEFDKFIDFLDENPNMLNEFSKWLSDNIQREQELLPKPKEGEKVEDNPKNL